MPSIRRILHALMLILGFFYSSVIVLYVLLDNTSQQHPVNEKRIAPIRIAPDNCSKIDNTVDVPSSLSIESHHSIDLMPRIETKECEDVYGEDLIVHWRNNAQQCCDNTTDTSITCFTATHYEPFAKFSPVTCKFRNLMKQKGHWKAGCAFDRKNIQLSKQWYMSGGGFIIDNKMWLRPRDSNTTECLYTETRPTFMFMREAGPAANMFHELAQLFALYVTKHVHGIGDSHDPSQVLLVAFDRFNRASQENFVGLCDDFLEAFSSNPVVYHEDVPFDTCFSNAMVVYAGVEGMAFWHKWGEVVTCHHSLILMSFQKFLLRGIGIQSALSAGETPPRVCWISRGSDYDRNMEHEAEFIDSIRKENPELDLHVGVFGSGELITLRSQVLWSQNCTVMAGAHGAGLTHSMWMPEESVLVEIRPPKMGSYRNLARLMGHQYLHVQASSRTDVDWNAVKDVLDAAIHLAQNMNIWHNDTGLND